MSITVRSIHDIAPYQEPHALVGIRFRPARQALGVSAWGMNVLELDAHCDTYPEHDHSHDAQEELYVVIEGSVVLVAEGTERVLARGDMARVAPTVKRKLVTRAEGATVLAIGATPGAAYTPDPTMATT
jgi:uncharacterized cupin superfamily protein